MLPRQSSREQMQTQTCPQVRILKGIPLMEINIKLARALFFSSHNEPMQAKGKIQSKLATFYCPPKISTLITAPDRNLSSLLIIVMKMAVLHAMMLEALKELPHLIRIKFRLLQI